MSRSIGQIIAVAGIIAVQIIPGVGQAIGAAIAAGVGIGATTAATASAIAAIGFFAVGALATAFGSKPAPPADGVASTVKNPIPVRQYGYGRRRFYGSLVLFETARNGSAVDVYAFVDDEADAVEQLYLNDDKVQRIGNNVQEGEDNRYQSNHVHFGNTLGQTPNQSFAEVQSLLPGIWTPAHRGDGVVTGYLVKRPEKTRSFTKTYPQGDNIQPSIVIRATKNCFDPRTGTTGWTENPVLHLLHYLTTKRGYDYNRRIASTVQYWIDAANICDELIPLKNGGSERRYRSCVSYNANSMPKEIIASLLQTFDGWFAPRGDGAIVIYAGKLYTPTVTLGPDEIINYNLPFGVEAEERVDQLTVSYVSEPHDWNVVDTTPWGEPGLRTDAFGPQTPSYSQNRRLAKRQYARINEANRGTITTNLLGRKARGQRYIYLNITEGDIEWYSGLVEVTGIKRDFTAGGLSIEWVAVDENIDAWSPATEEGEPAALGDRIAPQPLETPVIASAVSFFDTATDGGTGARVRITVASPTGRPDYTWYARWKRTEDNAWNEQRYDDVGEGSVILDTGFVPAVDNIETQVLYTTGGRPSDWSASAIVNTSTDAEPPLDATSITLTNWSDTLDLISDPIARASSYRWRFYAADGTTLVRTIITSARTVSYSAQQAAVDGARRAYIVRVAGVNSAGAGGEASTGTLSLPAPPVVTGVTAAEDTAKGNAVVNFTQQANVAGYSVATSTIANFNPLTQGFITRAFASPAYIQNLAVATYYTKVAAYDAWTDRPDLLNYSTEATFTITAASGGSGGGGGGGGGGYCVTEDTPVLLADGTHKPAGELVVGDLLWTQHEDTMQWGVYPVEAIEVVPSDDVWFAQVGPSGLRATGGHRVWLSGGWVVMRDIGVPTDAAQVVRLTVTDAHTYISAGILSHNAKPEIVEGS